MEKLDKVIAGLRYCINPNTDCEVCDDDCPYLGKRDGHKVCVDFLMEDALELLKLMDSVRKDMWDRTNENHRLKRELKALREKLSWVEEMLPTMPNDWGEYPPEFPREGM